MAPPRPPEPSSPAWQPSTRLVAGIGLMALLLALVSRLRDLLLPLALGLLLAYLLHPVVTWLNRSARLPRPLAVTLVYLLILVGLSGATTGIGLAVSEQLVNLVQDLGALSSEVPAQIQALATAHLTLGPWTLDMTRVNLAPLLSTLASALQPLLSQTGNLVASLAGATASAVGLTALVLVLGFYLLLDFGQTGTFLLGLAPDPYRADFQRLMDGTARVWQAFLRGQVLLAAALGAVVALILGAMGVRLALVLGLIAGLLEFVPFFGPFIAGLVAVLLAFFQGSNWWGLSPWAFAGLVLAAFVLIQQLESNILAPRIIGHSLELHPLVVLLAALAGGSLAGLIGVLLAAPAVATLRLWLGYLYRKTVGLETWPPAVPSAPRPPGLIQRWRSRRRSGPRAPDSAQENG